MTADVFNFPPSDTLTAEQAIESAKALGFQDVMIIGYDENGDFMVRSSRMNRKDALWLAVRAQQHALDG